MKFNHYLLVLSILNGCILWTFALQSNMMIDIINSAACGLTHDGRNLRTTYFGLEMPDAALATLVFFYEALSNGLSTGPSLLFSNFTCMLSCVSTWCFIECRRGRRHSLFRQYVYLCSI